MYEHIVDGLLSSATLEPRDYQLRIVKKVLSGFAEGGLRSVLIESPTGSGKTVMALLAARCMADALGVRVGWVAMRRHLLAQARRENESRGINAPVEFMSMFDKDPKADVQVLVVDEAQHDVTSSMVHMHAVIKPRYVIGLSATPFRADRVKLCFDKVIKDAGIPALIDYGYLARYHHYTIPEWGVDGVTGAYLREPDRWGKSIMYFHRLAQCREAFDVLTAGGVACEVVDGSSDAERQIADFHANKIAVLVNCMKLTEGFDCPDLKTVFCRPSCKSVTVQMAGRVLRKHPDHPYKQIVQAAQTKYLFQKTALAALQFLWQGGGWRTLEVNPRITEVSLRTMRKMASVESKLPKFVTENNVPRHRRRRGTTPQSVANEPDAHDITPPSFEGLPADYRAEDYLL